LEGPRFDGERLRNILRVSAVCVVVGSIGVGAGSVFQVGFGLRKFGGEEYIPAVFALSTVRVFGARIAFGALCIGAAVSVRESFARLGLWLALATPCATLVATALTLLSGCVAFGVGFAQAGPFWSAAWAFLRWDDLLVGVGHAVALGIALALALPFGLRLVGKRESKLARGFWAYVFGWVLALPVGWAVELAQHALTPRAPAVGEQSLSAASPDRALAR
jgi:ABC-type transporter Mla maintaining outer membrane lipid asymmetry permease subunit MlaE